MSLTELIVDDVRCIEHAELRLHPGHNLIWGGNGSGKTSLLESIFLLGRGRSFRTRNSERLIRHGRERLVVFGRATGAALSTDAASYDSPSTRNDGDLRAAAASDSSRGDYLNLNGRAVPGRITRTREEAGALDGGGALGGGAFGQAVVPDVLSAARAAESSAGANPGFERPLGVQVSRTDGTMARIGGATAKSLTALTQIFPVQVIDPGIHKLVEEGGHRRRRWMDWGVFHVEPQFGDWWLRYTRALKQRNAALRVHPAQASVWDPELVRLGELIAAARHRFVETLLPYWHDSVVALSGLELELHYFKGWAQDITLAEALLASRSRDEAKRLTHPGPHRSDLLIRMNGRPAREVLSRGQQKLVAVALTLAQLNLLQDTTQTTSTLLLDDPAAELDGAHLRRFIEQVMRLHAQLILTSLHSDSHLFGTPNQMFHVEQGKIIPT